MKGLIPAAGLGTRLHPITLAIPKELMIVGEKAIIEYVIEAMKQVGITEITIIVGWKKHAILDYLGSGKRLGVKISYIVQDKQDGLAKAVESAKHIIGDESFLVVLGDDFFYPITFLKEILTFHNNNHADATIGVHVVDDTTRHGIIKPGANGRIDDIIEKPSKDQAPSDIGVIGIYLFNSSIFDAIAMTKPGLNNEYQLTDSIKVLIEKNKTVLYKTIDGIHIDIGTISDYRNANTFLSDIKNK
jgi:dTDP-glucose pyrophosphorylase